MFAIVAISLVVLVGIIALTAIDAWRDSRSDGKKELQEANKRLIAERAATLTRLNKAKKVLSLISSDRAGNPQLEAQLALEEIEADEIKELN